LERSRENRLANLNRIILIGRLTADPELRSTTEGLPLAKFRLAVDRPATSRGENGADLIDIVAWRDLAEACGQLKKGQLALVEGRIQNRTFEDQSGQRRWVTEVVAKNMTQLEKGPGSRAKEEAKVAVAEEDMVDDSGLESDLPF
jgi:single-strand DNA-binding protein